MRTTNWCPKFHSTLRVARRLSSTVSVAKYCDPNPTFDQLTTREEESTWNDCSYKSSQRKLEKGGESDLMQQGGRPAHPIPSHLVKDYKNSSSERPGFGKTSDHNPHSRR